MPTHEGKCFHLHWWLHCNWELSVSCWIQVHALPWTPVEPQSSKSRNVITLRCWLWCHYEIAWWKKISRFHTSASQHFRGLETWCGRGWFSIQQNSLIQHSWPVCVEGIKIMPVRAFLRLLFPARCAFCISMFVLKIYNGSSNDLGVFTQSHTVSAFFISSNHCYFSLLSMLGQ